MRFLELFGTPTHWPLVASFSALDGVAVIMIALTEESVVMGPTFLLIAAALACEYNKSVAVSPESLLRGLSTRFPACTGECIRGDLGIGLTRDHLASVKEACVLAMLRLSNECEEVPEEVIERVRKVSETAGKFLRRVWRFSSFPVHR